MQDGNPIALYSKALGPRSLGLSVYEEFLAIIQAVQKWRTYLFGNSFVIKRDHESLKYIMEQRITTILQQNGCLSS